MAVAHVPVLLEHVLANFAHLPETGLFLDATVGLGGHSAAILEGHPGLGLLGLDRDPDALSIARTTLAPFGSRVRLVQTNFRDFAAHLGDVRPVAVLVDLGASMMQMKGGRGFSFRDESLDMRMGPDVQLTAADVLRTYPERELERVFRDYGEEPRARRLARSVAARSQSAPYTSAREFAADVADLLGTPPGSHTHPATRVFQALRIEVNGELEGLDACLTSLARALAPGGIMQVIAFHSLEDRIVKHTFRALAKGCVCPPDLPVCGCGRKPEVRLLDARAAVASDGEVSANPASRSARLRAVERLP